MTPPADAAAKIDGAAIPAGREALKLTLHAGERDRAGDALLADAIAAAIAAREVRTSVVLRGALGFGRRQALRTDLLLTVSEDLPVVTVAVDEPARIVAVLDDVRRLGFEGPAALERARLLEPLEPPVGAVARRAARRAARASPLAASEPRPDAIGVPPVLGEEAKLTVYVGRGWRVAGRPAYAAVVEALYDAGVAGATALVGVDGTLCGERRRARFFAGNADVPAMVVAVGERRAIAAALPAIAAVLDSPAMTLERVTVCKRDGRLLAAPPGLPDRDADGRAIRQRLTVFASEQSRHGGRPLHEQIARRLRELGAAGATCLRGVWGYHGEHRPHGDAFWRLRRRVPMVTTVIDEPARARRWLEAIDELTDEAGLVTSEAIPALRAGAASLDGRARRPSTGSRRAARGGPRGPREPPDRGRQAGR